MEASKGKVENFDMSDLDKYTVPVSLDKCAKCNFSKYPSSMVDLCNYSSGKKYTDKEDKVQPISSTFPYVK